MADAYVEQDNNEQSNGSRSRTIRGDERRHSLVLAAYELIAEKGFERLRTRDVAARAGVNIATLHYYFASKEDLIRGVVEHLLHIFSTVPAPLSELETGTPLGQVREMFITTQFRLRETPQMFVVLSELVLRSLRDPSIQSAVQQLDSGWHSYLAWVITDGVRQGMFRADLDPSSTATKLIVLLKGACYHSITSPNSVNFDILLEDIDRMLLR